MLQLVSSDVKTLFANKCTDAMAAFEAVVLPAAEAGCRSHAEISTLKFSGEISSHIVKRSILGGIGSVPLNDSRP